MKSNLFNLLSLLVVLTLLLTTSGTPVTAQARLTRPNPQGTLNGYTTPESPSDKAGSVPAVATPSDSLPSTRATQARVRQSFGQLPLYFVENQGQLDERVAYYIQGSDKTLYFTSDGVTFALTAPLTPTQHALTSDRLTHSPRPLGDETSPLLAGGTEGGYQRWAVKLDFVDANPNVRPIGQEKTEAVISYFKGKPDEWHAGLPTYASIIYPDLWPGIDLVYYGTANQLKYEFIVHPGADPNQIRLAYRGAASVSLNAAGQMQVTTPLGGFTDDTPMAYQEMDGQRVTVPMAYQTFEVSKTSKVSTPSTLYSFHVGDYDTTRPLILDPAILVYCGYIGGSGYDAGIGIAVDGAGNAYITGYTNSTQATFPVVGGPDLTFNGGPYDAFVAKVRADGTGLVYAGYIGGNDDDRGNSIAVDGAGNVYVTGLTYSTEATFPVIGGPDLTFNGGDWDAFVVKVRADGAGLVYAGYIGGSGVDVGYGIAVDGAGNAYVTGYTASGEATFPVTVGPDLTYNGGDWDAFVVKVRADSTGLVYAGYLGGSNTEQGISIAVDGVGNAYVTGLTCSSEATFPVTVGPDLTFNGVEDAFVAKVRADGAGLVYAGYIGGSSLDIGSGIAVDGVGNAYVTGDTTSTEATFPVTVGPDLTHNGGGWDAFVTKVRADGAGLVYAGYIGGNGDDFGYGIAVDGAGNAYVSGYTSSTEVTFPVTVGPDLTYNGGTYGDAFVAKVRADGTGLVYAGYIGGNDEDLGYGIAVDRAGNAYVTGYTFSTEATFPVVGGPDLTFNGGTYDAFVAKVGAVGGPPVGPSSLYPVYPLTNTISSTVMYSGIVHRYYRLRHSDMTPIPNAIVSFQVGSLQSGQATSTNEGMVDIAINTNGLVSPTVTLPISITQVIEGGLPITLTQKPMFNLHIIPREFETAWLGGGSVNGTLGSGFDVPGLSLYLKREVGGGLEVALHETTPLTDTEDSLSMCRQYSVGTGVGASMGTPEVGFDIGPAASAEVMYKTIQELELVLDDPYTDASKKAEAGLLLASLMDIARIRDPFGVALVDALINDEAYLGYVTRESTAIGVEGTFKAGLGGGKMKLGQAIELGLKPEVAATLLLYGEYSNYSAENLWGLSLEQGVSVNINALEIKSPIAKAVLWEHLSKADKVREELFFKKSTNQIDHFELSFIGKSTVADIEGESTVKFIIDGASVDDALLASLNNLAMLKAVYANQSNPGLAIGAPAMVREIQNLINSTPIARYEIEVGHGASLANLEIPDLAFKGTGTIDIGLGSGVELEQRQTSLKTEGVVMAGGMYPLAEYEPYNGPSGKSFVDLLNNALQGAWLLVKDSFTNIVKTIESGVDFVIDLFTPDGGATITGNTATMVSSSATMQGIRATIGTTVTISAVGWTQNGFAVGGIYKFSPEATTFSPGATLSMTYTESVAAGLDESKFLIYRWNAVDDNWTPLPSHMYSTTNAVTTTITQLGTYAVGYDATGPQITPLVPITDGATIEARFPPLSVVITDTGSGVNPASVIMKLNSQSVPGLYDAYSHVAWYTPTLPLANGAYTLTVSAQDMASNLSDASFGFRVNVHFDVYLPTVIKSY